MYGLRRFHGTLMLCWQANDMKLYRRYANEVIHTWRAPQRLSAAVMASKVMPGHFLWPFNDDADDR